MGLSVLINLRGFASSGVFGIFPCPKNAHLLNSRSKKFLQPVRKLSKVFLVR